MAIGHSKSSSAVQLVDTLNMFYIHNLHCYCRILFIYLLLNCITHGLVPGGGGRLIGTL